jgi:hypothetical protein
MSNTNNNNRGGGDADDVSDSDSETAMASEIMAAFSGVSAAAGPKPKKVDDALVDIIGAVSGGGNGGGAPIRSENTTGRGATDRVTTIPSINQAYRTDPTAAVIANIPPYERPEDIELWNADGRIERMVQWYDEADQRAEALHRNPRYDFSRKVKTFVLDHRNRTSNNIVDVDDPLTNIRVIVPPSTGLTEVTGVGPAQINLQRTPAAPGEGPAFALGGASVDQQRRQQDFYYGRQVNDALQTIGVSGRFQLDDSVVLGANLALGSLTSHNARKFRGHKLDEFLGDEAVMTMMVRLAGTHITHMNIVNPPRYYHAHDSQQRKKEIAAAVIEMDEKLKYDHTTNEFAIATDDEMDNQLHELAKRIRAARGGRIYK